MPLRTLISTLFPYTTLFRSVQCTPTETHVPGGAATVGIERTAVSAKISLENERFLYEWAELLKPYTISSRSEEHTSELQSLRHLVCRLLLEKKKTNLPHMSF